MAIRVEIDNLIQAIDTENTAIDEALSSIDSQIANTSSALSSSSLSGKAYDALRERLTGLRIPALQRESWKQVQSSIIRTERYPSGTTR